MSQAEEEIKQTNKTECETKIEPCSVPMSLVKVRLIQIIFTLEIVVTYMYLSQIDNLIKVGGEMTELQLLQQNGRFFTWATDREIGLLGLVMLLSVRLAT